MTINEINETRVELDKMSKTHWIRAVLFALGTWLCAKGLIDNVYLAGRSDMGSAMMDVISKHSKDDES